MMPTGNFMAPIRRFFSDTAWREEKVAAYASVGILVFLTSFFWGASRDFMQVVYGLSFFTPILLVLLLRKPDFQEYGGWFTGLALIYGAYATTSTLWSPAPRFFFFGYHLLFLAVWLAGAAWLASRGRLDPTRICSVILWVATFIGVLVMVWFYHNQPLATRFGLLPYGVARHPNTLAFIFGVAVLLAYLRWLVAPTTKSSLLYFGMFVINLLPVLAAQSRGGSAALAAVLVLAFFSVKTSTIKTGLHVVCAVVLGGLLLTQTAVVKDFFAPRADLPTYREEVWKHTIKTVLDGCLLTGVGLEKHSRIEVPESTHRAPFNHAHNAFVDAFYRTGLVGLLLMCAHMMFVFAHWSRSPLLLPLFLWLLLGCLTSLVDHPGFFWQLEATWWNYWIPAGLIGAIITAERLKADHP
jgi:O-antigen ligase